MFKLFFLVYIAIFISGCASNTPTVTVNTQVLVPDELIVDCVIAPPPDKSIYLNTTMKAREEFLILYSGELLNNSFICNKRLALLRLWKIETAAALNKKD